MFYNSKKLIDEKVLQQYYFERFMLSNSSDRKKLLPTKYQEHYSITENIKGLHPEYSLGETIKGSKHSTDFVLYPMPKTKLTKINIEIKWDKEDFEKQSERFDFYNGVIGNGFVVALNSQGKTEDIIKDKATRETTEIPVVYLDTNEFIKWFNVNSHEIISQAISNKMEIPPVRLTGKKYWVVSIPASSKQHYETHGREKLIWAFRDRKNPKNIMQILQGDYIIFVYLSKCEPRRMIFPHYIPPVELTTSRGSTVSSNNINWEIAQLDIFEISKGYHLDFSNKSPYNGFEEKKQSNKMFLPEEKEYTQFIKMKYNESDLFQFKWDKPASFSLGKEFFPAKEPDLSEFVDVLRKSFNSQGDAIEITRHSFQKLIQLVYKY